MQLPHTGVGATEEHVRLLLSSYRRWTGRELLVLRLGESLQEQLFNADTVILSHGTEADPVLNYGNQRGLDLWEMAWERFTSTPSRLTAEPMERAERDRFFEAVTANGYVDNYTGIRISSTGRRFYIVNATVWNVVDGSGCYLGQAAAFSEYQYL
ncbi:MEKHLA domain-containing protein [Paenibacillus sp. FSL H8-0548]|uniref:MEKHLA domain-containing protein n=1 Tax=Paenibacillus sp. FSL H8-0548 TaxID=1920422 RepID=UPI00096DB757|nr:MEKHLA domain-containing protein [Paenibacillus sp. FSL H8-0548]OMF36908.1 MEKHLA domain-containing protein [Paenibacillus sp. FSL H8-0548]